MTVIVGQHQPFELGSLQLCVSGPGFSFRQESERRGGFFSHLLAIEHVREVTETRSVASYLLFQQVLLALNLL